MRTVKKWKELKLRYLIKFPPRLQEDLKRIGTIVPIEYKTNEDNIFIYGSIKTGKTVLAAQMLMDELKRIYLHAIPEAHNKTMFVSFPDMLMEIKNTFNSPESTEIVMSKYLDAHLLVLDDFVTTKQTDWVLEMVYYIINYRYEYLKKTIITCNYDLKELENVLQEQRITSRLGRSYKAIKKLSYENKQ